MVKNITHLLLWGLVCWLAPKRKWEYQFERSQKGNWDCQFESEGVQSLVTISGGHHGTTWVY